MDGAFGTFELKPIQPATRFLARTRQAPRSNATMRPKLGPKCEGMIGGLRTTGVIHPLPFGSKESGVGREGSRTNG